MLLHELFPKYYIYKKIIKTQNRKHNDIILQLFAKSFSYRYYFLKLISNLNSIKD